MTLLQSVECGGLERARPGSTGLDRARPGSTGFDRARPGSAADGAGRRFRGVLGGVDAALTAA